MNEKFCPKFIEIPQEIIDNSKKLIEILERAIIDNMILRAKI